jgi:plasmid stabilization system protein ParE
MSGPFEIRYLSPAENDLDNIFDYIMKDNPSAAVSLLEKFDYSISQLAINPENRIVPKDYRLKELGYRRVQTRAHNPVGESPTGDKRLKPSSWGGAMA